MDKTVHKPITVVDETDTVVGAMDLMEAIREGCIRRVVRVFVFNHAGEFLQQKRGPDVLSPLVWGESASGHVDWEEAYEVAAKRELVEELGIAGFELTPISVSFRTKNFFNSAYKLTLPEGYVVSPKYPEVEEVRFISLACLDERIKTHPAEFAASFLEAWHQLRDKLEV